MNWLTNPLPKFQRMLGKKDSPDNLWVKCPKSGELVYREDLDKSMWVTPSGAHMRIGPDKRFEYMFDDLLFTEIEMPSVPKDPLKFKDDKRYVDRLKSARAKTGREDCID